MSGANASATARSHQTKAGANASAITRSHQTKAGTNASETQRGFTLIELMVSVFIIAILVGLALPLAKNSIQREREFELRQDLRDMRIAIDKYKDATDRGFIMTKVDTNGYPETLQVLVDGVQMVGQVDKKIKFLRRIPKDPMTNSTEWGLRSDQDDPKNTAWGGQDVFDVYTKSGGTGLDGTKYKDW